MAEKDRDGPDSQHGVDVRAVGSESEHDDDSSVRLQSEAIAQLQIIWEQFTAHVDVLLRSADLKYRQSAVDDLMRIRNTLVVLEKPASQFVIEELLSVLKEDVADRSSNGELARVLLSASLHLGNHFHQMREDVDSDNALSLIPLVNDCRAYRDEMFLSDSLMLAAGIELPVAPSVSVSDQTWSSQREVWVNYASSNHISLVQRLLHWWRGERPGSVGPLLRQLDRFASLSEKHSYLNSLAPLFQAASLVATAVKEGQIEDGPALRSLFAQLERNVHRCALVAIPDDLVPADLLRNYLYYAAQIESDNSAAIHLRRRFRLDRVRQISPSGRSTNTLTIGVGYHLTNAIRNSVTVETGQLRQWLDEDDNERVHPRIVRLRVRLSQLEPVLTIMGASKALDCLKSINTQLNSLRKDRVTDGAIRMQLAQSLVQLDILLDQSARQSILQGRRDKTPQVSVQDVYVDTAIDACLREARNELQLLSSQLLPMVGEHGLDSQKSKHLVGKLETINSALQMLPLPELSPLFGALGTVIRRLSDYDEKQSLSDNDAMQSMLASLLASVDEYLGCVFLPQPAAGQHLTQASEMLEQIMSVLGMHPEIASEDTDESLPPELIESLLAVLASIGLSIVKYQANSDQGSLHQLGSALTELQEITDVSAVSADLRRLASTARVWFEQIVSHEYATLSDQNLMVLDNFQGLLPILLNSSVHEATQVDGLDELLLQLEGEAMDAPDEIFADSEPLLDDLSLPDIGSLTLNVDDDLLLETITGEESSNLDGTLQLVFQHECVGHLDSLDEAVRLALRPHENSKSHLPNEKMLRALHTLTGSAQTIGAADLVAIVLPLQRASLSLHREGRYFDAEQTRYIGDLVVALRSRLDSISGDEPVPDAILAIEQKLGEFLSQTVPGISDTGQGLSGALSIGSQVKSLEDVFADESSEILDKLRNVIRRTPFDKQSVIDAQSLLHTLKGSARMVGKLSISECAHELESSLQSSNSSNEQLDVLKAGYRSLHGYLLRSTARRITRSPAGDEAGVGAPGLAAEKNRLGESVDADGLLDLATDLTVNQVRLSEELKRLRSVCQDIDSTSMRWRNLLQKSDILGLPATTEMLADMEAVCLVMRNALRQAEREQQQASRVSANLQQSLVRSRLCKLEGMHQRLSDTITDMARICGVSARFEFSGGEIMIDRDLFRRLTAPLEHLARNAVVHGIEAADQRLAGNKPGTGVISLSASVDGTNLVLQFTDDGRGVSRKAINQILKDRGEASVESDEQLQSILLTAGFSSIEEADTVAGHGLGLSAVQTAIEQMKGGIQLRGAEHAGLHVTLRIPQHMVVKQVVLVRDGDRFYGIPVVHVKSVQLAEKHPSTETFGSGVEIQTLSIKQLLGESDSRCTRNGQASFVSVAIQEQALQLEIDEIIGYREIVTQPLGSQLESLNRFSDGSVLPAGQKVLVLDLPALLKSANTLLEASIRQKTEFFSPLALVVDDSHTTRKWVRQILRRWGIVVNTSKDGLDALESIESESPDILIVDLEMPRLDGFSLLRRAAQKYPDAQPSIIVVSHQDNKQDRDTAAKLGAVRYLVKPYSESQLHEAIEAAGVRLPDLTIA
ncbi:MAG: response regulator [Granulosicoccus sp.]